MKKNNLFLLIMFSVFLSDAQELIQSYYYADGYAVLPKMLLERKNDIVIPFSITKNKEKKAGILYMNKNNSIKEAILFEGKDNYVINEIIESKNGNLLVSAEGYSEEGQESLYFIELNQNGIINDFVFNEDGNELDPFAILELGENIVIGGFVKNRELVSNSFYNMYSEKQMIYVAEFTKSGKKIWSKGFDLAGYEKGICNQMIKQDNGIVLLCHANKIGEKMAPILINIDFKGNIKNIVEVGISNNIVIGSRIVNINNQTKLVGSYMNNVSYLFNYLFNENLKVIESSEYIMPGRILINSFDANTIVGSIFKDKTYNNLVINFTDNSCIVNEFGSDKTDMLIGKVGKSFFGYKIGNINNVISRVMIFNNIDSSLPIDKQKGKLFVNDNIKYNIETKFIKSSINKGVAKVKRLNVSDKFMR
tara:strand:+ start:938 stop:2200 length:1263 start_codon:yes stop_codon:yes gene_type:complete